MDATTLVQTLADAARRHDFFYDEYSKAVNLLFQYLFAAIQALRTTGGTWGSKNVFKVKRYDEGATQALVVKSNLVARSHHIAQTVLTFESTGLGYYPTNGVLGGYVAVVLSDGDYWELYKQSRVPRGSLLMTSMISSDIAHSLVTRSNRKYDAYQNVTRETMAFLWTFADKAGAWSWADSDEPPLAIGDVRSEALRLLEVIFNPEGKEWVYKQTASEG